jgi:isoquinoline 1-oxidoreductase beta subunit
MVEGFAAAARDPSVSVGSDWLKQGDAEGALGRAATVIEAEYQCDYAYHAQMEPLNAIAPVSPSGDAAEIWCSTQGLTMAIDTTARALGIPHEKIKLNHPTGAGQMGTPLAAPAINNAFAALTGKRRRETPMTPERVKRALA